MLTPSWTFFFNYGEKHGLFGKTYIFASPPILGTPSLPTDNEITRLGSSFLPARK